MAEPLVSLRCVGELMSIANLVGLGMIIRDICMPVQFILLPN